MFPGVRLLIKVDNKMGLINTKTFVYVKGSDKKDVEERNIPYLPLSFGKGCTLRTQGMLTFARFGCPESEDLNLRLP